MQQRIGPNRVGPFGLLQSPGRRHQAGAQGRHHPEGRRQGRSSSSRRSLATVPAFLAFAVIPFGPEVSIFGHKTPLQLTDFPVAVLYILAIASVGIYGIVLAGWSSRLDVPAARRPALERADDLVRGRDGPVVRRRVPLRRLDVHLGDRRPAQAATSGTRLTAAGPVASVIYVRRRWSARPTAHPFDLPEAEGELVGGFHTEYCSLKFALFFLAEYINLVTVSALATTLFLGGWRAPWPISLWTGANAGWWPLLWFFGKLIVFIFVFIWLRGTLPRLRYDQFMKLGWKVLIPVSLVWILAVAAVRVRSATRASTCAPRDRRRRSAPCCVVRPASRRRRTISSERRPREEEAEAEAAAHERRRRPAHGGHPCRRCRVRHDPRARDRGASVSDGAAAEPATETAMRSPVKGFGVTFRTMFKKVVDRAVPRGEEADRAALPRPARRSTATPTGWRSASAASCAPGPARPTRSTSRAPTTPTSERGSRRVSATAASTRSTTCAASSAGCASRRARPAR